MYEVVKTFIQAGNYDLTTLLAKIDTLWVQGSLTDDQREKLRTLAQDDATTAGSVDVLAKLQEHDQILRELSKELEALKNGGGTIEDPDTTAAEYVAGKWYHNGDKVLFDGKVYICTAPKGVVCVWSPAAYPRYWQEEAL